ncbi:MAG: 4Fe-4S binding protein [Desulfobacteraceae bacterium]|nr:MAG: 4Fe-4S binding protein [Desulfobacteraceae bacterium]
MPVDIYRKLAEHLDNLPGGFPATEKGVELRILRRLFNPNEAELALHLRLMPEESKVIADRAKIAPEEATQRLEKMARKGLVYRMERQGIATRYMANQYVVGIMEFQVNNIDLDLINDMNEYMPTLLDEAWKFPQKRTIPVARSLTHEHTVLPYERADELVRVHNKFLVAPCMCFRKHIMLGKSCKKPEETCLILGDAADYYLLNGLGRLIDLQETLDILNLAEETGLVFQPSNAKKPANICLCCGCSCVVLNHIKHHSRPASLVSSPFVATVNIDTCVGCGKCLDRCQMEALKLNDDTVALDVARCIGCGLCVTTCPTGSLSLLRKSEPEQPEVPKNMMEIAIKLGRVRGKL